MRGISLPTVNWATALYGFLRECEMSSLPKEILDCGAGGDDPPLLIFKRAGYITYGLDICDESLMQSRKYCDRMDIDLGIFKGDMRFLPFRAESFSFVYSYNAIYFLTKSDVAQAMREIERVLRPEGLCFVNFMSVDDPDEGEFSDSSFARNILGNIKFSKHEDDEADLYFDNFTIQRKEKRTVEMLQHDDVITQAYIDYIARKR
jgi:ubiquinone/menaquinone biosynthesis C-methylase UbiE